MSNLTGNTHDNTLDNNNATNEKGGVIPTVLSYVGLGGNNSTSSNTASDATKEPAFGAAVGPHSSDSSSTGGLGSSSSGILGGNNAHSNSTGGILGGSNSGSTGSGILPGSSTHDSHSNSTGGILPGSNTHSSSGGILPGSNTHSSSSGGILGGNNTHNTHSSTGGILGGNNTASHDGYAPAPTLNPHDEERARVVAERAMGSTTTGGGASGLESGSGLTSGQHAGIGSTGGLTSGQHVPGAPGIGHESGHHGSGVGSAVGLGSGAGLASGLDSDRHGSGVGLTPGQHGSALDSERHGSGVGSGVGLGSGLDSDRHGSGVGSGVGLGHDSARHGSGVGSGVGLDSSDSARHGSEHHESTSGENAHKPPVTSGHKGNLENKSSIPTAGGIKLGEKHWGESDIVPEFPKPREEENISSSSGQPDRKFMPQVPETTTYIHLLTNLTESTRDNTSANTGSSTIPPSGKGEHGEQKEGIVDKVKDALHMGGHK